MAELVDALVSKTSEVTLVPVRPRPRVRFQMLSVFLWKAFFLCISHMQSKVSTENIFTSALLIIYPEELISITKHTTNLQNHTGRSFYIIQNSFQPEWKPGKEKYFLRMRRENGS